ncbi:MAG: HTTM domain-containing protein [Acidobacteria bacterium]|nr:HTTM domain-containing protein [Acidobacteriota bacterium]
MRASWEQFWFAPGDARNLALARIVVAATALWGLLSRDLPAISGLPAEFWAAVPANTRLRYLLYPGHEPLERILEDLALAALAGLLLGVLPSLCALISGLLLYHLAPLETIIWNPNPYIGAFTIPVLALFALAASPCGDAWSVGRRKPRKSPAWAYTWPLRLIQVELTFIYFFSGYSKLRDVGWSWASAENMRLWMLTFNQGAERSVFEGPGLWLADHPALCLLMGIGSLAMELLFPAVLVSRLARRVLIPAALAFHLGILVTMNIAVFYLPLFVVFLPPFDQSETRFPLRWRGR